MNDWFETLEGMHAQIWDRLVRGVLDRHAPARHVVLATCAPDGWPEARTVVLRGADRSAATLDIHTDLHSSKVASLTASPRATIQVWDTRASLQIRAQVEVQIASGPDVAEVWAKVPDPSRQSYGVIPPPGQPIAEALAYEKRPALATFAVLRCQVACLDALHLGERHRRARFLREDGWAGQWVSP